VYKIFPDPYSGKAYIKQGTDNQESIPAVATLNISGQSHQVGTVLLPTLVGVVPGAPEPRGDNKGYPGQVPGTVQRQQKLHIHVG
jgi:hypothetical protein